MLQLERRSIAQNIGNAYGCLAGIFNCRYYFQKKVCRDLKIVAFLKILKYWTQLHFDLRYEKIEIMPKGIFMVMMPSMTPQSNLKVAIYIHVKEWPAPGASCKGNVMPIHANIVF